MVGGKDEWKNISCAEPNEQLRLLISGKFYFEYVRETGYSCQKLIT